MLQQILKDMYIDPELLAELDEEQKQMLFCKMREEQVRKWRETENDMVDCPPKKQGGKKVSFLTGGDGEPLVVVLGEDVDALLQERARKQAEMEEEAMKKATEEELDRLVKYSQSTVKAMETSSQVRNQPPEPPDPTREAVVDSLQEATFEMENDIKIEEEKEETKQVKKREKPPLMKKPEIPVKPYQNGFLKKVPVGVSAQIKQFERMEALKSATLERAKKRREKEILNTLRTNLEVATKEIPPLPEREEVAWQEQERKAKEAERNIREIARRARLEHRRSSSSSSISEPMSPETPKDEDINGNFKPTFPNLVSRLCEQKNSAEGEVPASSLPNSPDKATQVRPKLRPVRPSNKESIIEWFQEEELPKGVGLTDDRTTVQPWFHGIISRLESERLLERCEVGSFMVRVSERIWGYAVSYKAPDRCRHYLIDGVGGQYAFLGSHQTTHSSLNALIEHHNKEFITMAGQEVLNQSCRQLDPKRPDYLELLVGSNYFSLIDEAKT